MAQGAERLVGRTDELAQIEDGLGELAEGRPAVIELVGEPGIGKTRLLAELARRADARGQIVLSGSASELERDLPFWVFVDALDDYVRGLEPDRLAVLADDVRSDLAAVLPCLSAHASPHEIAGPTSATAATAPSASCSSCWRARSRSCSCWTTFTGAIRPRSSCSDPSSTARRRLPCCWRSPCGRGRCRSDCRQPSSAPFVRARRPASSSPHSRATRPASSSVMALGADGCVRSLHRQRRQPVLSRAARPHARSSRSGARPRARALTRRRAGSTDRGSGDRGGARPALGRGAPRARRGSRRGRSLRSRACGRGRRDGGFGGTQRTGRASAHRPGARDRCATALPFPASARPPLGLRGDAGRLAARSARAQRGGLTNARRVGLCACPPRRARRAPRRPCGDRDAP